MNKLEELDEVITQHTKHVEANHEVRIAKELAKCEACMMYANLIVSLYKQMPFLWRFIGKLAAWIKSPIQMYKMKIVKNFPPTNK